MGNRRWQLLGGSAQAADQRYALPPRQEDLPAEIRIGDSLIMVTPATERDLFPGFVYV